MPEAPVRVVAEKLYEGSPGECFSVGVEYDNHTVSGYRGRTTEEGPFRFLVDQGHGAQNLAEAVVEQIAAMRAVIASLVDRLGIDLVNLQNQNARYELTGLFGSDRISTLEAKLAKAEAKIDALKRCEHGRRGGDNCCYCPGGMSVGGVLKDA